MVYYCADDYGLSEKNNNCIINCLENGVLNKVSVLPNGDIKDFKSKFEKNGATISLHLNLVEGYPLSEREDIPMLCAADGTFKHSFVGLFLASVFGNKIEFARQVETELRNQILSWKEIFGDSASFSIDSHQHIHMIPLIFKILFKIIHEEHLMVDSVRIPAEPLLPYISTPSLYLSYSIVGLIKQWLLKFLFIFNRKVLKKSGIAHSYFLGILFSGKLTKERINKLLPKYVKLAKKHNRDIEIAFHPGGHNLCEPLPEGCRKDFEKFYFSPWRKIEYDTLLNL